MLRLNSGELANPYMSQPRRTLERLYAADPRLLAAAQNEDALCEAFRAVLDDMAIPVFAVDAHGYLVLANRRGHEHLNAGALFELRNARLAGCTDCSSQQLHAALQAAAGSRANAFAVPARAGQWMIRVMPLRRHSGMALVCVGHTWRPLADCAALRQVFGFSEAEAQVARELVCGARPKVIAAKRNVAESTVRSQIREVFDKAGVRGIADLARVLSAVPALDVDVEEQRAAREDDFLDGGHPSESHVSR